jgi:hypothetical protein
VIPRPFGRAANAARRARAARRVVLMPPSIRHSPPHHTAVLCSRPRHGTRGGNANGPDNHCVRRCGRFPRTPEAFGHTSDRRPVTLPDRSVPACRVLLASGHTEAENDDIPDGLLSPSSRPVAPESGGFRLC